MTLGLWVQRLYCLGDWGAVTSGVEVVVLGRVCMGMTMGLLGRSGHAVVSVKTMLM